MARNIFDTIEMCDKHFNEKTFGNISHETLPASNDNESVVDVNVDNNDNSDGNIDPDIINNNNETIGGNENES